jgi:hypothetical protein
MYTYVPLSELSILIIEYVNQCAAIPPCHCATKSAITKIRQKAETYFPTCHTDKTTFSNTN